MSVLSGTEAVSWLAAAHLCPGFGALGLDMCRPEWIRISSVCYLLIPIVLDMGVEYVDLGG